jgi:hypothetical protein
VSYISEAPAMDISRGDEQSRIADTLIQPLDGSPLQDEFDNGLEGGVAVDRGQEVESTDDVFEQIDADLREHTPEIEAENQPLEDEAAPEPVELAPETLQQLQEGPEHLAETINEYGLNDVEAAKDAAAGICGALEINPLSADVNVEQFGNLLATTALWAGEAIEAAQGDLTALPEITPEAASHVTREFLQSFGIADPRQVAGAVDEMKLASTLLAGAANFYRTERGLGITELSRLNDPQTAEAFFGSFLQALRVDPSGLEPSYFREISLRAADAFGQYLQSFRENFQQVQEEQPRRSRAQSSSRPTAQFETNDDIFSEGLMEYVRREGNL